MTELSEPDRALFLWLRDKGILRNLEDASLRLPEGIILVACGDGDEFPELFSNASKRIEGEELPRIHTLALNGGALNIPPLSPVNIKGRGAVLLENIKEAQKLKGIANVVLCAHAPCGAAASSDIEPTELISLLLEAADEVMNSEADFSVTCFLHIDHGEGRKRTYLVSSEAWKARIEA